ncbi:MAG: hypothetical protein K1X74_17875 [Pirellulales bacterium]|nr:hypothetical protein [Pirellulales bacterium]
MSRWFPMPRTLTLGAAALLSFQLAAVAPAQQVDEAVQPGETDARLGEDLPAPESRPRGSITNLTEEPIAFRIRRARGATWTDEIVVGPGEQRVMLEGFNREEILGTGRGVPVAYIVVQYRQDPGYIRVKLTGRTGAEREIFMPFYFFVRDSNGFGRLIQAADEETAKRQQAELLARPRLTPEEVEQLRVQAIASGRLYLPQSDPPAWEWPPIGTGALRAGALIDGPVYFGGLPWTPPLFGPAVYGLAVQACCCP